MDYIFGRIINILFMCSRLTDVGCTLRLTNRKGWKMVKNECKSNGSIFATEWELAAAKNGVKFIEVPIHFRARVGKSSVTDSFSRQVKWGLIMFFYIWKVWIYSRMGKRLYS